MSRRYLLDAGPWFAFLSAADKHHAWAVEQFRRVTDFASCEPVLTEVCHRLAYYGLKQDLALQCVERGAVRLEFAFQDYLPAGRHYVLKYADQKIDLADACLCAMAEDVPQSQVVTLDRLFERIRFPDRSALDAALPPF